VLSASQMTNWKFVHPMQVRRFRPITVGFTVAWMAAVLLMTAEYPSRPAIGSVLLVVCPLYILGIGVWRTLTDDSAPATDSAQLTSA
jgi:phosphatidylserine synthase